MVYRSFSPQRLEQSLYSYRPATSFVHRHILVGGMLARLIEELAAHAGWDIQPGPICAGELPLFIREAWQPPGGVAF